MRTGIATAALLLFVAVVGDHAWEGRAQSAPPAPAPASPQQALINQYCVTCHSDRVKAGGLSLSELDLDARRTSTPRSPRR